MSVAAHLLGYRVFPYSAHLRVFQYASSISSIFSLILIEMNVLSHVWALRPQNHGSEHSCSSMKAFEFITISSLSSSLFSDFEWYECFDVSMEIQENLSVSSIAGRLVEWFSILATLAQSTQPYLFGFSVQSIQFNLIYKIKKESVTKNDQRLRLFSPPHNDSRHYR